MFVVGRRWQYRQGASKLMCSTWTSTQARWIGALAKMAPIAGGLIYGGPTRNAVSHRERAEKPMANHRMMLIRSVTRPDLLLSRCKLCGLELVAGVPRKNQHHWKEIPPPGMLDEILEGVPCERSFDPAGHRDWLPEY